MLKRACLSLSIVSLLLLVAAPVSAQDWPQWRGPNRDGIAPQAKLPRQWPEQFPGEVWSVRVGEGYSSPVIVGNQVFIQGRLAPGEENCFSFDAATGKELWRVSYNCFFTPPDPTAGRGPNSTPTVDGDRVYMLGLGGMFHCLEAKSGRVLWKHDFAGEYWGVEKDASGMDAWFPVCGAAASPLVLGKQVVVPVGGKKAGAFAAFDRETGMLSWHTLAERSSYSSPVVSKLAEVEQLIGFTGLRMVGLDLTSKKVLWEQPFKAGFEQTILTPVLWKDRVILGGEQRPTIALQITRENGTVVQKEVWRSADLRAYMVTPVVMDNHLVGLDNATKRLVCLDLETGVKTWESPRFGTYASLVKAGDRLLALSDSGELLVLEANPREFQPVGRWKVTTGGHFSYLAVVGSRLYIKDRTHLRCFDLRASS